MKSLALRVAPPDVEDVLDSVIMLAPRGIHEIERDGEAELVLFGELAELPTEEEVMRLCGSRVREAVIADAPDTWQGRRLETHRPLIVGSRFALRPDWAPPAPDDLIDVVLRDEGAFGTGEHPSTRACLELLEKLEPRGAFADLGCGSGVLAIAGALLGWSPVIAIDADPDSVEAARANAACNEAEIDARVLDLCADAPPDAVAIAANVPLAIHRRIAAQLRAAPAHVIAGGVTVEEAESLAPCYLAAGFEVEERRVDGGWVAILFEKPA